ncbi:MAG: ferric reductase-like transmembrane domain-containing protein [Candidatus Aenigmarchaeota archaeon]|nr:ferric reductase-like transmembrane domain-containing protein [Candidatus Aenigmarchaeota archaeon]
MTKLFQGARENKKHVFSAIGLGILFWLVQFAYQYYILVPGEMTSSIVRSTALTGATLIGAALLIGPLAKLFPTRNFIQYRRTIGVIGFTFAILHVLSVMFFFFNFGIAEVLYSLNPYTNPLIFGLLAFVIYIPLYLTSTDWAVEKLNYKRWKAIHRLVYIAWIFTILHYMQINPNLLYNPVGYLLLGVTYATLILEFATFIKYSVEKGGKGKYLGSGVIIGTFVLFFLAYYLKQNILVLSLVPITIIGGLVLYSILKIKQYMVQKSDIHRYDEVRTEKV